MEEDNVLDFNFWPSFADMMLALVFVILVVFVGAFAVQMQENPASGKSIPQRVETAQRDVLRALSSLPGTVVERAVQANPDGSVDSVFHILLPGSRSLYPDITIRNTSTSQRISFADYLLFDVGRAALKDRYLLMTLAARLKVQLRDIREIQIQGHSDTDPITIRRGFYSNLDLAANRAMKVYELLQESGIDPASVEMCAVSYGEYMPVQRSDIGSYDWKQLRSHNATPELKSKNRRVEVRLVYHE